MKYTFEIAQTPERVNALANHPRIKPYVMEQGSGDLDLSSAWGHCVALLWPEGGFLFHQRDDMGLWEVHTLFEDSRKAHEQVKEAAHFIFTRFCNVLTTRVPASNVRAYEFARSAGMRDPYTVKDVWHGLNGKEDLHVLTWRPEQFMVECMDLEETGHAVHAALEAAGFHTNHGDDPVHERVVGFVAECFRAGVPHRGVFHYNRWAISCGYDPIEYVEPMTARFGQVQIRVLPDGYEVTLCQSEQS